jgi:hypothetical protein
MKNKNYANHCYEHTIICNSKTSDAELEFWNITLHNRDGNKFKAHIKLSIRWKNSKIDNIKMPFEEWNSKKEFIEFLQRECDK